jgi:hypothetical protein
MAQTSDFLTVATVDYIPRALVTLRSAMRYGKHTGYHLFVLDATVDTIRKLPAVLGEDGSGVNFFGPFDLGSEREAFLAAFKYYNAVEMSCFAKYVALAHVFRTSSAEVCVYADADIFVVENIGEAINEIADGIVLVTPHTIGPTSDSREHEFLLYGWVNAGFFCVRRDSKKTHQILDWLIHRISRRGFYAPHHGISADQTWLSSLPFVFPGLIKISRNHGLNVGFWNLEQQQLIRVDGGIHINGVPLLVFHFSGFNPAKPSQLSSYFPMDIARAGTPLGDLCLTYKNELDAIAPLGAKLTGLTRLQCSKANLQDRMLSGSIQNGLSLVAPSIKPGLFTRIGQKMDLLLRGLIT